MSSTFSWTLQDLTPNVQVSLFQRGCCGLAPIHIPAHVSRVLFVSEAGASPSVLSGNGDKCHRARPALGSRSPNASSLNGTVLPTTFQCHSVPTVAHAHGPRRRGHCTSARSLLRFLSRKPWWGRTERLFWGQSPEGHGTGLARGRGGQFVCPDWCPVFFGAQTTSVCLREVPRRPRGRAV